MQCGHIPPNSLLRRMNQSENGVSLHGIKKQSEEVGSEQTKQFLGGEFAISGSDLWLALCSAWDLMSKTSSAALGGTGSPDCSQL